MTRSALIRWCICLVLACLIVSVVSSVHWSDATWDRIATWAIIGAAPLQLAFAFGFFLLAPWWRSWLARVLLSKSGALAIVLSILFVVYFWDLTIPRPVAAIAYVLVFCGIAAQLTAFVVIRLSPEGRAEQAGLWHMAVRRLRRGDD